MKRISIIFILIGLASASPATASISGHLERGPVHTRITVTGPTKFPYQAWVKASLVPTPDRQVEVIAEQCDLSEFGPGQVALACTTGDQIWIAQWLDPYSEHQTFFHELGHVFAIQTGIASAGDEVFADAYSHCATEPIRRHAYNVDTGLIGWRALRTICRNIRQTITSN